MAGLPLHRAEDNIIEALDCGLDLDEYLEWIDRGIPHEELMALQTRGLYQNCDLWCDLRTRMTIVRMFESLDLHKKFLDDVDVRGDLSDAGIMRLIWGPAYFPAFVKGRKLGLSVRNALVHAGGRSTG